MQNSTSVTMTVKEIQVILRISRNKAYELIGIALSDTSGQYFKTVKIGQQYRVVRKSFEEWLNGKEDDK